MPNSRMIEIILLRQKATERYNFYIRQAKIFFMNLSGDALEHFYSVAESFYKDLSERDGTEVIVHYSGDLNFGFANALTSRMEKLLDEKIENKTARKRFFTVFIEAIQNIRLHSEMDEDEHVHSIVTVYKREDMLCARFSNIIEKCKVNDLKARFDAINEMDPVSLKAKYMKVMMNGARSSKGGAGLGIITMVMRSKNSSPYHLNSLNDEYEIFSHTVCVDLA